MPDCFRSFSELRNANFANFSYVGSYIYRSILGFYNRLIIKRLSSDVGDGDDVELTQERAGLLILRVRAWIRYPSSSGGDKMTCKESDHQHLRKPTASNVPVRWLDGC
jgi:hypothetical protein